MKRKDYLVMNKICFVVTIPGTIEAFFVQQLIYLSENGFDVTVVCSEGHILKSVKGNNIKYHPINIPRGVSLLDSIKSLFLLIKFFREEQFDIIQYSTPNAAFCASIAARIVGCRCRNYHLMGFRFLGAAGLGRFILKSIEKITCDNSTSIECVSPSNLKLGIEEKLFPEEKATVVWHGSTGGVDLARFDINKRDDYRHQIREKYSIDNAEFVYGFVGRVTRDKGINELFEAFAFINDAKLLVIGNPEGIDTLNSSLYRQTCNNRNVIFINSVSDIEKYYSALDVLVLPSYREGFGNVVIEAAAMGTPAIISDIPGPTDAVSPGVSALLVKPRDMLSLKAAMLKIRNMDYRHMGILAHEFAKGNFDSDVLCQKILERKMSLKNTLSK